MAVIVNTRTMPSRFALPGTFQVPQVYLPHFCHCKQCRLPMPICIECRFPVNTLYTTYSKADDRTLGKGVRLTQCPRCKRFADKYVEHDFVVLFIDLVLIKPQVHPPIHLGSIAWNVVADVLVLGLQTSAIQSSGKRGQCLRCMRVHTRISPAKLMNIYLSPR